ncbi:hypothetical protein Q4Q35_13175 [Flavivirga aquimarina]|uniref:Uncharacterized protein n=1 Tax=Flavivirga aquimarina TaxID=2027862 RepID=A0ABT8WCI6_9FLAO|nr:hypothetical protein [Flavivirga aquimarina]MDO5970763.1 hypothetical protein [Flavivirga aquimarina]
MALAINVKVTLDDLFSMVSEQAMASGSDSSSGSDGNCTCETSWWDSKVYGCIEEDCSITEGIPPFVVIYNGQYENCQGGGTVAHCWDCKDCNAGPFK